MNPPTMRAEVEQQEQEHPEVELRNFRGGKTHFIRRYIVNTSNDEREVYFFMAYLAQKGSDLSLDIPTVREDYELVDVAHRWEGARQLTVRIPLSSEVNVPVSIPFATGLEPKEIEELAEELANDLDNLPIHKDDLIDEILELRAHAEAAFDRLKRKKLQLQFLSLDFDLAEAIREGEASYVLKFEQLGDDSKPVQARVAVSDAEGIDAELEVLSKQQATLAARAREITKEHAHGAIDVVLVNRLERHNLDVRNFLKTPQELEVECAFQLPDGEIRLFWEHGVLTANMPLTADVHWVGGAINLREGIADIECDLTGRKVSDLISHPDLPDDLIIASGRARGAQGANFRAALQYNLFDSEVGISW